MKICSFLPSGTEILFALGLGDSVEGVTFECDYPPEAKTKQVIVHSKLPPGLSQREIDQQVKASAESGRSLYGLDTAKLEAIQPDLVVTQSLCHVCAASPDDFGAVLGRMSRQPVVLALSPRTVEDVWSDIHTVGRATGRTREANRLVSRLKAKASAVIAQRTNDSPRVLCLEWFDPPFVGGHWVPEMVAMAGGVDVLGHAGKPSYEVSWETITESDPDLILAMPCGYHAEDVREELERISFPPAWYSLRAVQHGNVYAMDASSHFSRPGPRIAEGIQAMSTLFERTSVARKSASAVRHLPTLLRAGRQI